ncbi:CBS domain-containing protein [Microtetraspora glauca]|uniref:CBS domain-containing protein n=1 Tax=Microtetraspora glauca TaxID=1996 RepID=A0ABV3GGT0_MICGL
MRIGNVYRPVVFGCRADERLSEVARRMVEKKVGALAVLEGDQVTGIITERDLVAAMALFIDPASVNAAACAPTEVKTAGLEEDSREVARRMLDAGIRHLPVEQDGRMVGMVSMRDLLALETWAS